MFQIKVFVAIVASMVNRLRTTSLVLTDFNVGSNVRTILEACAQEIDELYQQMIAALQAAIAQSTYTSFGFAPLQAVSASGTIRVTITSSSTLVTIAAGSLFSPLNTGVSMTFVATQTVVILPGNTYVDVPVTASSAGSAGNIGAGTGFSVGPSPAGFVSASNLVAFLNGLDAETLAAQFIRFTAYIVSLARSTLAGLAYGASSVFLTDAYGNTIERVAAVSVVEPYATDNTQPPWKFIVYIYNGVPAGSGASAALVSAVQAQINGSYDSQGNPIDGYKAAGTVAVVQAVTLQAYAITAALTLVAGTVTSTAVAAVEAAWAAYLSGLAVSAGVIVGKLEALAFGVPGVFDCQISAPAADVAGVVGTKVIPGAFTVTSSGGS